MRRAAIGRGVALRALALVLVLPAVDDIFTLLSSGLDSDPSWLSLDFVTVLVIIRNFEQLDAKERKQEKRERRGCETGKEKVEVRT
ncbi:hypothetical protein DL93DRAFT_2091082 [Clavulina sp. PMI_390]|nr:hypothetical protein DL93DRAFT_2091082 [Clavulina sp. PMI_390]